MGVLRTFLALAVVSGHVQANLDPLGIQMPNWFKFGLNGGFAVFFFFVVSGFLISYALAHKYRGDGGSFYKSRFVRIYSLYWPMVLATFAIHPLSWPIFKSASIMDEFTGLFLIGIDWRVALTYYPNPHLGAAIHDLAPAWTLGSELAFYSLAPLLLFSWRTLLGVLLAAAAIRIGLVTTFGIGNQNMTYFFFPGTLVFFLIGALAREAGDRLPAVLKDIRTSGVLLIVWLCSLFVFATKYGESDTWQFWLAVISLAGALPGLFESTKDRRLLNFVGDLSYPIYLTHSLLITIAISIWAPAVTTWIGPEQSSQILAAAKARPTLYGGITIAAFCVVVVIASGLAHTWVERPMVRVMNAAMTWRPKRFHRVSAALSETLRTSKTGFRTTSSV
jgi:peptidoglycan/LPS O-acetylase OafA/YrhL